MTDDAELGAQWRSLLAGRPACGRSRTLAPYEQLRLDAAASAPTDRPYVVAHVAQSIDGYLALAGGDSAGLSGRGDFTHLHRLRALCDAVLVGGETARLDNPQLTTRLVEGPNPLRVVALGARPLPATHRLLTDTVAPTLIAGCRDHAGSTPPNIWLQLSTDRRGRPSLTELVRALHERGVRRLLAEGGGRLIAALIDAGLVDELQVAVAPVLLGRGRRALHQLPVCQHAPSAWRLGDDVLLRYQLSPTG